MNRLYRPSATAVTVAASDSGAGAEVLAETADLPAGEQPGRAEDDPDGHRPGGSFRARSLRLSPGGGR